MRAEGVQAYIIPSVDQHMVSYLNLVNMLQITSNDVHTYLGSRAPPASTSSDAVVIMDKAGMWTDGRYFNQAGMQMDDNWTLMKDGMPGTPSQAEWLAKELKANDKVGVDANLFSIDRFETMHKELAKSNITLTAVTENLVDEIWTEGRPPLSNATIFVLEMRYTGKSWEDKIKDLREQLISNRATAFIVYKLDEVAWLLNLRGKDVPSNPFFFAFVIVTKDEVRVYVDDSKLTNDVKKHLKDVEISPYNTSVLIADIKAEAVKPNAKIWLSKYASPYSAMDAIGKQDKVLLKDSPIALPKSIKNSIEIKGMKNAYLKDNVAMVEFFYWLKNEVAKGNSGITEMSSVTKLEEFKSAQEGYQGYSFDTIAGFGPNGAIIHYRPEESTNLKITDENTFLVDSGSQFLDGTTDTTRTVHFGTPTPHQKDAYTRVLKGQIDLALTVFPETTQGRFLDVVARKELWRNGLDYRHGTGHGIGMFLGVHEGPQKISIGCPKPWEKPVVPGMFQSDEPGYYEDGKFGIRLETVIMAVDAETKNTFNDVKYVKFEPVSFILVAEHMKALTMIDMCNQQVPYWKKLIDVSIMTPKEIDWLNDYHKQCREKVGKMLKDQKKEDVYKWLVEETEPISTTKTEVNGGQMLAVSLVTISFSFLSLFSLL
ncbi:hypothetical protein pdam_00018932 [Pocillopora damicornis]|uniref:Xaa-Pro aminopeptidase 1 n=1 Tax=Pocillopora damicornis TaxID=46731 RepID=A0A3M6UNR5_POCDA|nr:hypothetical protein pdam_00018932 [Pocillopora damicornis]